MVRGWALAGLIAMAVGASAPAAAQPQPPGAVLANIDLTRDFATKTPWRLIVRQGRAVADPIYPGGEVPGELSLCLASTATCLKSLEGLPPGADDMWGGRELREAKVVRPGGPGAAPLLLVQTASEPSGDGDQLIFTQLFAYRPRANVFVRVYEHQTGHNRNEEVRFVTSGPLRGTVIAAEPTENAPYGYWITVSRPGSGEVYRQVLRYRSATHYGDGNPLAVIDSEMPAIQRRLGVWRSGAPLPLPAGTCPRPRLIQDELWCAKPPARPN